MTFNLLLTKSMGWFIFQLLSDVKCKQKQKHSKNACFKGQDKLKPHLLRAINLFGKTLNILQKTICKSVQYF